MFSAYQVSLDFLDVVFMFFHMFLIFESFGEPSPTRILLQDSCGLRTFAFFEKYDFSGTHASNNMKI